MAATIDPGDERAGWEICQKMILCLMHSVFKTLLCGSDLCKVVKWETPETSFPAVTMTLQQYIDKLPLREIQKPVKIRGSCIPDKPRRIPAEVVGKSMTFTLHSLSPSTEQCDGKKMANSWFSLGGKKENGTQSSVLTLGLCVRLRDWFLCHLNLNIDKYRSQTGSH